ncbi:hypothetical protein [Myxococcus landrumensis]|uniref:Uncharacterized protein n=1 Tax=Myxococcus landrumensis TaxID=2813577 RepID=A0ABX7N5Q3_9BACT|nr:hypothetical protein [Myxococcus landrumus]QSQ14072.1 hypothetical protein JY572_38120 [Myxococcus landrumus]
MSDYVKPQPPPKEGTAHPTWFDVTRYFERMASNSGGVGWSLLVHDAGIRDAQGAEKYGVRHRPDNGRDHAVDGYQELLGACCYWWAEAWGKPEEPMRYPTAWSMFVSTAQLARAARQYLYDRDGR